MGASILRGLYTRLAILAILAYNVSNAKEACIVDEIGAGSVPMAEAEEWRNVPGWEGWYSVSNLGRVRSEPRKIIRSDGVVQVRNGKLLAKRVSTKGYVVAALTRDAAASYRPAHQLVIEAFVGPIPNGMQVNHKNGLKDDNRLCNLEVVTPGENVAHAYRTGLLHHRRVWGEGARNCKLTAEQVAEMRERYASGNASRNELASVYGIGKNVAGVLLRGIRRWGSGFGLDETVDEHW